MEAKENSQQTSIFDNMVINPKSQKHNFEIHLLPCKSTLAQRNPHVFCKKCGKFGRKDYLKRRHPKDHPYDTADSLAFVCHGEEPNRDKYGEFEQFQEYFSIQQCSQEDKLTFKEQEKRDQLKCQRYFWKKEHNSDVKISKKNTKDTFTIDLDDVHDNNPGQDQMTTSKRKYQKRDKKSKSSISHQVNNSSKILGQKKPKKDFKKRGKSCGDMRSKKEIKQTTKKLKLNEKTVTKFSSLSKKTIKTLKVCSNPVSKICATKIKKLNFKNQIKNSSKKIKKQVVGTTNLINSQDITAKVGRGKKRLNKISLRDFSKNKWQKILMKFQIKNQSKKSNQVASFYKSKLKDLVTAQDKELYKTWNDHKDLMLKERQGHVDLYHQKATFDSTKQKLENSEKTIEFQREQIKVFIKKLAKYAPMEVKDYPTNLIKDGEYDPIIWKLTVEAESDEALIKTLKEKLKEKSTQMEQIENQNQELKSQFVSAMSKIQLSISASKLAILNQQTQQIQPQICMVDSNHQDIEPNQIERPNDAIQYQATCLQSPNQEPQMTLQNQSSVDSPKPEQKKAKKVSFITDNESKDDNLPNKDNHPRTKLMLMKQKLLSLYRKKKYQTDLFQGKVKIKKTLRINKPIKTEKDKQSQCQESSNEQNNSPEELNHETTNLEKSLKSEQHSNSNVEK